MTVATLSNMRYSYMHDDQIESSGAIDSHHIFVKQSTVRSFLLYFTILFLLANTLCLLLLKNKPGVFFIWSNFLAVIIVKSLHWNSIKKESVVIMPGFGVQLETHFGRLLYWLTELEKGVSVKLELWRLSIWNAIVVGMHSEGEIEVVAHIIRVGWLKQRLLSGGRVVRRFVPIGRILKPVLSECVTPVTCYWSLGLIVREATELLLVFQELRPPVKMLVPVWKALCAASDSKESIDTVMEDQ